MGNCLKSEDGGSGNTESKKPSVSEKPAADAGETKQMKFDKPKTTEKSWDKMKKNLNKEDFIIKNKTEGEYVKAPGTINGQQFCVENCKDATIYLCDYSAAITIDDCENCRFYIGPCESSVFVRNTKNCKFIIACQQFRMRDGNNLDIIIFSQTPPIIESSVKIRFGCFKFSYFELQQQFKQINLNVWNNRWSEIHDYTKKTPPNYSYLNEELHPYDLIPKISSLMGGEFSDQNVENQVDLIVPITLGNRQKLYDQDVLLFIMPGYENGAEQFIPKVHSKKNDELFFVRSRAAPFLQDQVPTLFTKEDWKNLSEGAKIQWGKSEFILINFGGKDVEAQVRELCEEFIRDKKAYFIWTDPKKIAENNKLIFEAWREEK